jgi:hypothetical protein
LKHWFLISLLLVGVWSLMLACLAYFLELQAPSEPILRNYGFTPDTFKDEPSTPLRSQAPVPTSTDKPST